MQKPLSGSVQIHTAAAWRRRRGTCSPAKGLWLGAGLKLWVIIYGWGYLLCLYSARILQKPKWKNFVRSPKLLPPPSLSLPGLCSVVWPMTIKFKFGFSLVSGFVCSYLEFGLCNSSHPSLGCQRFISLK